MSIILLVGFNLFVSSSVPQGNAAADTPSGLGIMIGAEYKVNFDLFATYYSKGNYDVKMHGISLGKEFLLGQKLSILPQIGMAKVTRSRENASEHAYAPLFMGRLAYLFSNTGPTFQIGISLREAFNEEINADFIDFGIGFRM